jgi:hypothetical protein
MQPCWFGDERDLWKWTVAVRSARDAKSEIVYVAMMQDSNLREADSYDPEVKRFFRGSHSLSEITKLGNAAGIQVVPFLHPYRRQDWKGYFEAISKHLNARANGLNSVVLIDPDTGLWSENPQSCHIRKDELRLVWDGMKPGDTLLVYQHQQRQTGWHQTAATKLATCLAVPTEAVQIFQKRDIAILQMRR